MLSLHYLGQSWTLDDLQESTAINKETILAFLLQFIEFGCTVLYNHHVCSPNNSESLIDCEAKYKRAGFPGCIGSADASHIIIEKCSYWLRQMHLGYKLSSTAPTYNITVNHRRHILSSTKGHPARFNDKTLGLYDDFLQSLKNKKYEGLRSFTLKDFDLNGNVIDVKYNGCYVLVDNGYLPWSVTVPPQKECTLRSQAGFSEWLESLCKDVECTFGILKGRWRVLKTGIRLHGLLQCDRIWLTCVALHNWLLEVDGLSKEWQSGVRSDYESNDDNNQDIPFAIRTLVSPAGAKVYDFSNMGHGNDCIPSNDTDKEVPNCNNSISTPPTNEDGSINISDLSLDAFCKKLIIHFNIMFKENKIVWPQRNK